MRERGGESSKGLRTPGKPQETSSVLTKDIATKKKKNKQKKKGVGKEEKGKGEILCRGRRRGRPWGGGFRRAALTN